MDITGALSNETLALSIETRLPNPSVVHILSAGRLTLDRRDSQNDVSLDLAILDPFSLQTKDNDTIFNARGTFEITGENGHIGKEFI